MGIFDQKGNNTFPQFMLELSSCVYTGFWQSSNYEPVVSKWKIFQQIW
jgi:hypothetical protein